MSDCIFCDIVAKKIPNYTVYEDDRVLAFLDIFPHVKGHTVVVPKEHGVTVFDYSEEVLTALMVGVRRAMARIDAVLSPAGYNVGWNHGDAGGQVVKHVHVHIVPRYDGDNGGSVHSIVNHPSDTSVEAIANIFAHNQ